MDLKECHTYIHTCHFFFIFQFPTLAGNSEAFIISYIISSKIIKYNLWYYSLTSTIQTLSNGHAFKELYTLQDSSYEFGVDEVTVIQSLSTLSIKEFVLAVASNRSL